MSNFPVLKNLLNKHLVEQTNLINTITKAINKHSDYKDLMNNYTLVDPNLLAGLTAQLVNTRNNMVEIDKVYHALVNGAGIIRSQDLSNINYQMHEIWDRLPDHIQEELKDRFEDVQKRLASSKGLV